MDRVGILVPLRNRPGRFAVIEGPAARILAAGSMKLFQTPAGNVEVETITRNRRALEQYDPAYRVIFVAIEGEGRLITETGT